MEIDTHWNFLYLLESLYFYHRHGLVIIGSHISSRICHIDILSQHTKFIGLESHRTFSHGLQRKRIYLIDCSLNRIRVIELHRSYIRSGIGIPLVKTHIAHIWDINLPDAMSCASIQHLYFIRAIDDGINSGTIYLNVIAHITQFLDNMRIAFSIEITYIIPL